VIALILTILLTSALFFLFKEFEKRDISTNQAITFNYLIASVSAYLFTDQSLSLNQVINSEWMPSTIILGILFVVMFNIMAKTTQKLGISIASMASKISLVIPFFLALIINDDGNLSFINISEKINTINLIGVLLSIVAIYLSFNIENKKNHSINIAIILFVGAGILDSILNYIQKTKLNGENDYDYFIISVFLVAFLAGLAKLMISSEKLKIKNILAGICLGIPNYFSIYFVLISLKELGGAIVFPVLNIGVVLTASILGFFIYKEKLTMKNWIGITMACIAILFILGY